MSRGAANAQRRVRFLGLVALVLSQHRAWNGPGRPEVVAEVGTDSGASSGFTGNHWEGSTVAL